MRMFYSDLRGYAVWTEFAFFISLKHANRRRNECFKARREQIVQTAARAGYRAHISLFYLNHFLRPLQLPLQNWIRDTSFYGCSEKGLL
jgi:hypothetical protein